MPTQESPVRRQDQERVHASSQGRAHETLRRTRNAGLPLHRPSRKETGPMGPRTHRRKKCWSAGGSVPSSSPNSSSWNGRPTTTSGTQPSSAYAPTREQKTSSAKPEGSRDRAILRGSNREPSKPFGNGWLLFLAERGPLMPARVDDPRRNHFFARLDANDVAALLRHASIVKLECCKSVQRQDAPVTREGGWR